MAFADASGVAMMELGAANAPIESGQNIRLAGTCTIQGPWLLWSSVPLVDNDGVHLATERSGTAVLLAEFTTDASLFGRLTRRSLDVLSGVPSIVFGLFGNVFFCKTLGLGFSILSGGLTLACMVLPILIRSTEEGFRAVPAGYRLSAAALGLSRTTTLFHLLLPAAVPGLLVGLVLGVGRAMAETAALIFTSGYVDRMPESLLDSGRALSIHIFDLSMNVSGGDANAYASALVLVVLLLAINGMASWLAEHWLHRRIVTV
jgi:phosphate transport system permease protein